ncbi:MAG: biopolymer transporter ExbD [Elainella sp. Prado103]|jgi:biopolymer transport protein ExbD|nr:biopolymer transporter ExbD [Elainella sp. Prado103]
MKLDYESTEPDVRIEIVPLIDVIFCILTFFILAAVTLTRQSAINVDLPRADSGAPQMRQTLIVSVDRLGTKYLEKLPIPDDQLYQAILAFRQQNPEGMIVLYAERAATYDDVVAVLDLLRSAGGDRVALATLPGENNSNLPGTELQPNQPGFGTTEPLFPPSLSVPNGDLPDSFNLNPNPAPADPNSLSPRSLPNGRGLNPSLPTESGFEQPLDGTNPDRSQPGANRGADD